MKTKLSRRFGMFPSANEDAVAAQRHVNTAQCNSPSYRLAFQDQDFLLREELRPVRLQLELLKPELALQEQQIESTVVIFGSARMVDPETANVRMEKVLDGLKKTRRTRFCTRSWSAPARSWPTAATIRKRANSAGSFPRIQNGTGTWS